MEPAAVREAEPDDYEAIRTLTLDAYVGGGHAPDGYRSALADVEDRARHTELLVAVLGEEQVVGSVAFARHASPYAEVTAGPDEAAFRMLAVSPAVRGRGIGRALIQACIDRAKADGTHRMVISTETDMLAAQRLYAAMGFRPDPARDWSPLPGVNLLCYVLELD